MKFSPLHDNILVELDPKQESTTQNGIITLATDSPSDTRLGTVIAIGPGLVTEDGQSRKPQVEVGQRVMLRPRAGTEISDTSSDITRVVLRDLELLGTLS